METIVGIIGLIIGATVVIWEVYTYQKNQQREKEKELKNELKEKQAVYDGKTKKKSEVENYCDHLRQKFKYLDFTGLNAILQKPLLLEDIYVKLRTKKSFRFKVYNTIAEFKLLDEERANVDNKILKERTTKTIELSDGYFTSVFENLYNEALQKQEPLKMVILGQPGSGKTTLMKWIALQSVNSIDGIFSQFKPVFIPLKDLGREPDKTFRSKNIRDLSLEMLVKENIPNSFFEEYYEKNKLIFLLDGLDEVADESIRKELIQWIQNQHICRNILLITSRFSGLQEAKGLKFHDAIPVFVVQDFEIADIERFLENWYRNIESAVLGDTNDEDKIRALKNGESRYEDLMKIIKDKNYINLRQLAVNPLLLTIIAIVHRTRAVLPKERHKLFDECLKVMIELWNVANRKLDVTFSVGNSLDNLSKLAVYLMKENHRELKLSEIKGLLPTEIEGKSLDIFLKEMVLKSGLLYESEGKYGFLHLTFQEYLAACYFAGEENQNLILEYRDKDYWNETFKLFANTGNVRHFFNEIIDNLEEKEYWQQMQLWDDCLQDTALEKKQVEIEIKFAKKILSILPLIKYKKENEELIIQLFLHYPLYKHARQFIVDAWNLFNNAHHPFVRSVGSSILVKTGKEAQSDLIKTLKERIETFEKIENKKDNELIDFIFQNNNSFVLLIAARRKLPDFYWTLEKLKSKDMFITLLVLRSLRSSGKLLHFIDILDIMSLRDILVSLNLLNIYELSSLRDFLDIQGLRDFHYLQDIRFLCDQYKSKYGSTLKNHKKEIEDWAIRASDKLHSLSSDELKYYFPGTTLEEIKEFQHR